MSARLAHPILGLDAASHIPVAAHRAVNSRFACRYLSRFSWKVLTQQEVSERWLVQEYDRYRAEPHVGANEEMLDLLRGDITLARKRVWYMAHFDPKTGQRNATPTWNKYNRGWRWQELLRRSRGERVV